MAGLLVWGLRMEPPTSSEGPAPKPPRYYLGELRSPAPLSGGGFQTLPYSRNEKRALDCGPVSHFWWRRRESNLPPFFPWGHVVSLSVHLARDFEGVLHPSTPRVRCRPLTNGARMVPNSLPRGWIPISSWSGAAWGASPGDWGTPPPVLETRSQGHSPMSISQ